MPKLDILRMISRGLPKRHADHHPMFGDAAGSFCLSDDVAFQIDNEGPAPRWMPPSHIGLIKPALIVTAGETLTFPRVSTGPDTAIYLRFAKGLPEISSDGMTLTLSAVQHQSKTHIASFTLLNSDAADPRSALIEVGHLTLDEFHLQIEAGAGPQRNPNADWAAIVELVIGPSEHINLLKARSFKAVRTKNEMAHFAAVYDHAIFQAREARALGKDVAAHEGSDTATPHPGEHPRAFAVRLMEQAVQSKRPDFAARLRKLHEAKGDRLTIASLCAGTAQIEAGIIRDAGVPVDLTLVDISDKLLDRALSYMPEYVQTRLLVQDVNDVVLESGAYDVVLCVSGIHHAVELEKIWRGVKQALVPTGELWLIGEQIGANGNKLLPQDYNVANEIFKALPSAYRKNAHTGAIDADLPNLDFGEATFEGIRSSEIEHTVNRFFLPSDVYKRNCFLWRFINQTYVDNYDLAKPEDVDIIRRLVLAEIAHFRDGGLPTEMYAAYRPLI